MDPQNINLNNTSEDQSSRSAIKFLSVEIIIIVTLALVVLLVLNYFNILSLSKMFPGQLGFLPHKSLPETTYKVSVAPSVSPGVQLTPEQQKALSYMKEALKPELVPSLLQNTRVDTLDDKKLYVSGAAINNVNVSASYIESIKSVRFKENGLPLGINVTVSSDKNPGVTLDTFRASLEEYFINVPNIESSQVKQFQVGTGSAVLETVWDDSTAGTKESRSVLTANFKDKEGNPQRKTIFIACSLYKDNPLYEKNTCYGL